MKLLRVRVDKGGATARDYELRRDPVWVQVKDLTHLIKEQTHASKVDFEFAPLVPPRSLPSWDCYAPTEGDRAQTKKQGKYGKPPPRKRGQGGSYVAPRWSPSAASLPPVSWCSGSYRR